MSKKRETSARHRSHHIRRGPAFASGMLYEPPLLFGGQHIHVDPKTGLSLYGPYSLKGDSRPWLMTIKIGIIGPASMVSNAEQWIEHCRGTLTNDGSDPFWLPHFPGCSKDETFRCELLTNETWRETIKPDSITAALAETDFRKMVQQIVQLYSEAIEILSQREPKPDVVLCCMPKEIIDAAVEKTNRFGEVKPLKVSKEVKRIREQAEKDRKSGQHSLFDVFEGLADDERESGHQNLRRGLKAESMRHNIPTQLVWPRTLDPHNSKATPGERPLQDVATRAWNFTNALYHKAGGTPWRLAEIEAGTCFVGVAFYREVLEDNPRLRTAMAQAFTSSGDGYVLRGESFEWVRNRREPSPHLSANAASALMQDVLNVYKRQNKGRLPNRVVVHKSSRFWEDELVGFREACKDVAEADFVAFGSRGLQFYRPGLYPPVRGTYVKFSDSEFALYTSGYIPYLRTYPGPRVPRPIEILEHYGDSPWDKMLREVMALTKMNWNTADFCCSMPITLAFAERVGHILAEMPARLSPKEEYRYYL